VILVGVAAGVVSLAGMRVVAEIVGPIFFALCMTVTVYPARSWLRRKGAPGWLATTIVVLGVNIGLIALVVGLIWGAAQFATRLPAYADQMQSTIDSFKSWLTGFGIGIDQIEQMLAGISSGDIIAAVGDVLGSMMNILSLLLFIVALVLFMGVDGTAFPTRMERVRAGRGRALSALGSFAFGTRKYFGVCTIFGGIVAVLDGITLVVLDIPGPVLWALLAFVTNYIPNIGFLIGLVPVAILALLTGGVAKMVTVIIVYCVLNLIIQSVIQPKFVGDSVGLTTTVSFLSLIVWAWVLGPIGAILAVPMTLLVKSILVDVDPDARWLQLFLGDEPVHTPKKGDPALDPIVSADVDPVAIAVPGANDVDPGLAKTPGSTEGVSVDPGDSRGR
jgi:predicted PurR-regulated permease PerM